MGRSSSCDGVLSCCKSWLNILSIGLPGPDTRIHIVSVAHF